MDASVLAAIAAAAAEEPMPKAGPLPDKVPGRLLSLDGDYLAYFMAGNDDTDSGTARRNAMNRIEILMEMTGSTGCVMHLSATGGTKADRYLIATVNPYQFQRAGAARPKNWASLRDFFESYKGSAFTPKIWADREADDGMAYIQQKFLAEGKGDLIVTATRDKDMRQYPGWHVDWMTYQMLFVPQDTFEIVGANELTYGHKWFWLQTLQGDSADKIPGLPSYINARGKRETIGEARAENALRGTSSDEEAFAVVASLYGGTYLGEWGERLAEQMLLLWLRRDQAASYGDALRWLKLDRSTDNFKELLAGFQYHKARVAKMKEEVAAIDKANEFNAQASS